MEKVAIGKIVNTCGLKGEVKVINYSDFVKERYKKGNIVKVINDNNKIDEELTVSSVRSSDKFLYVKFKEIESIEKAESYKESMLYVDVNELSENDENTFYHYELLNMEVYFNDSLIGKISEISDNGRQDLIRVEDKNKSFLVPFIDDFIDSIDVSSKKIILKNIEGLL